jgi:hypothetical protein
LNASRTHKKTDDKSEIARERVRVAKERLLKAGINKRAFVESTTQGIDCSEARAGAGKLRKDVMGKLFHRGVLDRVHMSAAEEIERAWQALHRERFAASSWREFVDEQRRAPDMIGKMQGRDYQLIRSRFAPWLVDIHRNPIVVEFVDQKMQYPGSRDIVMEILADNLGPSQADKKYKIRKGASQRILRGALERYCVIAGFVDAGK